MSSSVRIRVRFPLLATALFLITTGCVNSSRTRPLSELTANPRASDGISIPLSLTASDALERAARAAEAEGFAIDANASRPLSYSTIPRVIAGDSTVTLHIDAMPVTDGAQKSVVVLTATYSSRAKKVAKSPIVNLGVPNVLWDSMALVAKRLQARASGTLQRFL